MAMRVRTPAGPKVLKVTAAVVIGLSVGALVPPDAVRFPVVGAVPGLLAGGVGLLVGLVLYRWMPRLLTPDCGCAGDCGCS